MKIYAAPLRNHRIYVPNAFTVVLTVWTKYFIPFINPNQHGHLSYRNGGRISCRKIIRMYAVPQILTNCGRFSAYGEKLSQYGYTGEINLNLGCPSDRSDKKDADPVFLAFPEELDRFWIRFFLKRRQKSQSRRGSEKSSRKNFEKILEIYNRYPMKELIVHPRVQQDFYKPSESGGVCRGDEKQQNTDSANGDLFSYADYENIYGTIPGWNTVMIGRGTFVGSRADKADQDGEKASGKED